MRKKIYLGLLGRKHSLISTLVNFPPEGYEFILEQSVLDRILAPFIRNDFCYFTLLQKLRQSDGQWILPLHYFKAQLDGFFKKSPEGRDLTYSLNHLVFRSEPWILDLEHVYAFTGFNMMYLRKYRMDIEKTLASNCCKKILCWTELTRNEILWALDCTQFAHKLEVVYRAVPSKKFVKSYDGNKVTLLFVGTRNEPGSFEYKGGKEVLEAFTHLRKKYHNIELIIRSDIPSHIRNRYSKTRGLTIIEEVIPLKSLDKLFKYADIFLHPSHVTPAMVFLEAMSYELPIITTDELANAEIVEDGRTGLIIRKSERMPSVHEFLSGVKSVREWEEGVRMVDPKVVEELVEKTSLLIEDVELRRRMGKAGRWKVEQGIFSIKTRNEKLKRIFDEAVS